MFGLDIGLLAAPGSSRVKGYIHSLVMKPGSIRRDEAMSVQCLKPFPIMAAGCYQNQRADESEQGAQGLAM